jgi:hypothetical protein
MNLDLREPTIVIAGAFNPAIFAVGWIASELFNYADGEAVNATVVADMIQQTQRAYVKNVALMAEPFRLSVYIDDIEVETIALAEAAVKRAAGALPHTPVAGIGVNFKVSIAEPDADIVDLLAPKDKPEQIAPTIQNEVTSRLQLDDGTRLNLMRTILDDTFVLGFNYHTDLERFSALSDSFEGKIMQWMNHAKEVVRRLYKVDEPLEFTRALNN